MADKMLTFEDVRKAIRLLKGRGKASNTDVVEVVRYRECKKRMQSEKEVQNETYTDISVLSDHT